jgi:endoglucanase
VKTARHCRAPFYALALLVACASPAQSGPTDESSAAAPGARAPAPPRPDGAGKGAAPGTPLATDKVLGPWDAPYPKPFDPAQLPKRLPAIRVEGNRFVDAAGSTVVFQGVNISDPDKLESNGHFNRRLFEEIARWGANVIRIPVHPAAWRARGAAAYFALLDQALIWATELDMYVIIDWHSIGNLIRGLYQHPMYETSEPETYAFWRDAAFRYADVPTVAFYELFNEPTVRRGRLGSAPWPEWKFFNEEAISIIRAHDADAIALVAGFDYAYDLGPIAKQPIERPGIAYVSHPYPMKAKAPFEPAWDTAFGFATKTYPLMATEIGYMAAGDRGAHSPAIDDGSYGKRITDYLATKGASWVAWCFDPDWAPPLIKDWDFTPTPAGATFRDVMLARRGRDAR